MLDVAAFGDTAPPASQGRSMDLLPITEPTAKAIILDEIQISGRRQV